MGITKYFSVTAGILTGLLVLILSAHFFGFTLGSKRILQSCQGDYVNYNSYDPYCLTALKQTRPLGVNYVIMISGKDNEDYGHAINYIDPDPVSEDEIARMRVIWSNEGIEITFMSGHKLYVPKERFIGGR